MFWDPYSHAPLLLLLLLQTALLLTVMMATAMVVGDGVLTPSISGVGDVMCVPTSHAISCSCKMLL